MRELEGLDMKTQTFQLETLVRVFWYDYRLEYGATKAVSTISTVPQTPVHSPPLYYYHHPSPLSRSRVHPTRRS